MVSDDLTSSKVVIDKNINADREQEEDVTSEGDSSSRVGDEDIRNPGVDVQDLVVEVVPNVVNHDNTAGVETTTD